MTTTVVDNDAIASFQNKQSRLTMTGYKCIDYGVQVKVCVIDKICMFCYRIITNALFFLVIVIYVLIVLNSQYL